MTGVVDHAQHVVVGGVGVGPLLHDRRQGEGIRPIGVDLVAHPEQLVGYCAHGRTVSGADVRAKCFQLFTDVAVFLLQFIDQFHGDAQFGCGAVCCEFLELQPVEFIRPVFEPVVGSRGVEVVVEG